MNKTREKNVDPEERDIKEIVEKLSKILREKVRAAYLFGGRTKGYSLKGDYDIAVLMKEDYNLYELGEIQATIAEALETNEEKVDIICLNNAPPNLIIEALNGIPIIEEKPEETLNLKIKALTELLDLNETIKKIKKHN